MKRTSRAVLAQETLAICDAGYYTSPSGQRVDIAKRVARAADGTVLYRPDVLPEPATPTLTTPTRLEVTGETTCAALERLHQTSPVHLACLNFASAKNPGGGFLGGAQAQEEALARSSALYPCLLRQPDYYDLNRGNHSALYLDLIIYSPQVPFIRKDDGELLERPVLASVITAPAPNAGAVAKNTPGEILQIGPTLRRRAGLVLQIASAEGVTDLVLGAWGCGVFRNDPKLVARIFAELLTGEFHNSFANVVFAVYDTSTAKVAYRAFKQEFSLYLP